MPDEYATQFILTYDSIRRFEKRLRHIEKGIALLLARDHRIRELEEAAEAARARLKSSTDKLAGAVAANTPPPKGQ